MILDKEQAKVFWYKMNIKLDLRETVDGRFVYNANPGFKFATEVLKDMRIDDDKIEEILNNLRSHGAYTDGEIMLNCQDYLLSE